MYLEGNLPNKNIVDCVALGRRNKALDGLRGWLAVVVCVYHAFLIPEGETIFPIFFAPIYQTQSVPYKLLLSVFNGDLAVVMFFVMSGAVLFASIVHTDSRSDHILQTILDFTLKRIFRIYPVVILSLVIFTVIYFFLQSVFPNTFHMYYGARQLIYNMLLLKIDMYGVSWSLQVEIEAIPFIILSYFVFRRFGLHGLLFLSSFSLIAIEAPWLTFNLPGLNQNFFLFLMGMLATGSVGRATSSDMTDRGMTLCLILLMSGTIFITYTSGVVKIYQGFLAAIIVSSLIFGQLPFWKMFLCRPVSQFFADISYCFYALNPIFLELNRVVMAKYLPWPQNSFVFELLLAISSVTFSIPISVVVHRLVEIPGITAGRYIVSCLERFLLNLAHIQRR